MLQVCSLTKLMLTPFSWDGKWNSVIYFDGKMLWNLHPSRGNFSFLSFYLSVSLFNTIKRWNKCTTIKSTMFLFPPHPTLTFDMVLTRTLHLLLKCFMIIKYNEKLLNMWGNKMTIQKCVALSKCGQTICPAPWALSSLSNYIPPT